MNKLRNTNTTFYTSDYTIDLANQYKQILLKSSTESICAIANFDVTELTQKVNFGKTGNWQDYFTGNQLNVSDNSIDITLQPGEYRLYISK